MNHPDGELIHVSRRETRFNKPGLINGSVVFCGDAESLIRH